MENKETKYNLPDSWIWTTLGEIGIVTSGGTPSSRQPDFWGGDIAWITPADLSNYKNKYIEQGQRSITKVGLDNSSAKLLPKGTVLFSSRAPIGYTVIAKNKIATNQGFKNLILTKSGYPDYIYYYLQASKQLAESYASGTTFLELSATKFSQIPIPLPPLAEQYRIVDKIEELFSELDKAQENLLNAQKQLEIYRQVVLKDSFNGKLTEKWRLEKSIKKVGNWQFIKLGEIANINMGQSPPSDTYNFEKNGLPFFQGKSEFGKIHPTPIKYCSKPIRIVEKNDVLMSVRAPIGALNIANEKSCIGRGLSGISGIDNLLNNKFIFYQLITLEEFLKKKGTGSTFKAISKSVIESINVILPTYDEQKQIVEAIEYHFTLIDNLDNSVKDNLKRIDIFRQIILQKAFSGKLVPQNENDIPASTFLQRIGDEKFVYEKQQKEIAKNKPQKLVFMESNKTVKEILDEATEPIEAKEVWQKSVHKDDIEKFYEELKQLSEGVEVSFEGLISKLSLKR